MARTFDRVAEGLQVRDRALRRFNRALKTLSGGNRALLRGREEAALLQDMCRVAVESGGYAMAWVDYAEHDPAKTLRPVAHAGASNGFPESLRATWADGERGRGLAGLDVRVSIGISVCPEHGVEPDALLLRADIAARVARRGRNGFAVYSGITDQESPRRLALVGELRRTIDADRLALHYLRDPRLVERVTGLLGAWDVPPELLQIEITESTLMEDHAVAAEVLGRLGKMGIKIFIDDFGTGYSSLSHISTLPVSALKIDRCFITNLASDANSATLVSTIISLARSLRLKVVAEGVENGEQARILALMRCDELQGYHLSRPLAAEQFRAWLEAYSPSRSLDGRIA